MKNVKKFSLYGDIDLKPVTKARTSSTRADRKAEQEAEISGLEKKMLKLQHEMAVISSEQKKMPSLVGKTVNHRMFGNGTVQSQDGDHLTIRFPTGDKNFKLPEAVAKGFITLEDETVEEQIRAAAGQRESISKLEQELRLLNAQYRSLL